MEQTYDSFENHESAMYLIHTGPSMNSNFIMWLPLSISSEFKLYLYLLIIKKLLYASQPFSFVTELEIYLVATSPNKLIHHSKGIWVPCCRVMLNTIQRNTVLPNMN
jgi:hypothetical protein